MIEDLKPIIGKLAYYAQKKMGFKDPPRLFLKKDIENSQKMFGRTAHYDPAEKSITIYINSRHPKDILRSFAHELVHHTQNLRGDLSPEKCGQMSSRYAQDNDHMRNMEKQAYLIGNMCFRDWEDGLEDKDKFLTTQSSKQSKSDFDNKDIEDFIQIKVCVDPRKLGGESQEIKAVFSQIKRDPIFNDENINRQWLD